ncbi:GFA family protein [Paraburkholderia sp. D15]|uniref:GFA family protein n=1 Tax=Paraburkholderia sp. D15 TaxID=2880218 RepID=UPI0024795EDE|nr:GFA family protein [Paraburkholderia sp. D15]WGS53762.1 GFA family protein [Paraburkholderia sp. D15]
MLTGGCYCRAIRYEIHATPFDTTLCHCATCRKISAAPAVAWFSVDRSGLRWILGQPKTFESSPRVVRSFCGNCGTPLTYSNADSPHVIDVSNCSLDDPGTVAPTSHTWSKERLHWDRATDDLPDYPEGE